MKCPRTSPTYLKRNEVSKPEALRIPNISQPDEKHLVQPDDPSSSNKWSVFFNQVVHFVNQRNCQSYTCLTLGTCEFQRFQRRSVLTMSGIICSEKFCHNIIKYFFVKIVETPHERRGGNHCLGLRRHTHARTQPEIDKSEFT